MTKLTKMKNIGKELERKLKLIGINSAEELKSTGSKETFWGKNIKNYKANQTVWEICFFMV